MTEPRRRGRPRAFHDTSAETTLQSVDRAMAVLGVLAESGGLALSPLAARAGLPPTTAYRLLVTLSRHGMVELDPAAQTWAMGAGAFRLGSAFLRRTSVVDRARPFLRDLMEGTGETANLGIERGDAVLFVAQVETHATIRAFFPPGTQSPLHASGIGKALLARFDPARLAGYLARVPREAFTPTTLTDAAALEADLAAIRARGWALDNEERTPGMRCVAAAVINAQGDAVAGLSVSGPVGRLPDAALPALGARVAAAASSLSVALGAAAG